MDKYNVIGFGLSKSSCIDKWTVWHIQKLVISSKSSNMSYLVQPAYPAYRTLRHIQNIAKSSKAAKIVTSSISRI
ncbi:hypothetical protein CEXT_488171 [Caerostris extrusa]|uniref:Uncharacterized protein n=1 Tax=Caerostris extrusa TaxID=172846 RepID=A0AAV4XMM4_CAEEX|nr:hypothetical protein CEXT_488171 [Caerostris extrusa]